MARRSSGTPGPGGYWFRPDRIASTAASSISAGPSVSGKPWPRLTEPVRTASADISAKIVVPNGRIRATSGSRPDADPAAGPGAGPDAAAGAGAASVADPPGLSAAGAAGVSEDMSRA